METEHLDLPAPPVELEADRPQPWTEIEPGRFQPKRTRGSNPGRELG